MFSLYRVQQLAKPEATTIPFQFGDADGRTVSLELHPHLGMSIMQKLFLRIFISNQALLGSYFDTIQQIGGIRPHAPHVRDAQSMN